MESAGPPPNIVFEDWTFHLKAGQFELYRPVQSTSALWLRAVMPAQLQIGWQPPSSSGWPWHLPLGDSFIIHSSSWQLSWLPVSSYVLSTACLGSQDWTRWITACIPARRSSCSGCGTTCRPTRNSVWRTRERAAEAEEKVAPWPKESWRPSMCKWTSLLWWVCASQGKGRLRERNSRALLMTEGAPSVCSLYKHASLSTGVHSGFPPWILGTSF